MTARPALAPVRVSPAPRSTPPAVPLPTHVDHRRAERRAPYVQDALAMDLASASDDQLFGPQPTPVHRLPDPRQWAAHIAQALVEVMHGARPATQVLRWTSAEVYAAVSRRGALAARREARMRGDERRALADAGHRTTRRTQVVRVVVCEPREDVAEASVVIVDGGRVRALAVRLVGQDGRWIVDALQVG